MDLLYNLSTISSYRFLGGLYYYCITFCNFCLIWILAKYSIFHDSLTIECIESLWSINTTCKEILIPPSTVLFLKELNSTFLRFSLRLVQLLQSRKKNYKHTKNPTNSHPHTNKRIKKCKDLNMTMQQEVYFRLTRIFFINQMFKVKGRTSKQVRIMYSDT